MPVSTLWPTTSRERASGSCCARSGSSTSSSFSAGGTARQFTTASTQATAFVNAWRYIVDRFQSQGATNVGFYWCPDESGDRTMIDLAYPGNAYVDWVGVRPLQPREGIFSACDFFGWGTLAYFQSEAADCGGNQAFHDWHSVDNEKPVFIGETSTLYHSADADAKNNWYADIALAKDPTDSTRYMSNLIGVTIFDQLVAAEGNSDWRIDSNQTSAMYSSGRPGTQAPAHGLNGWVQWVNGARWKVGVAP
jgi:hypothetical protein